MFHDRLKNKASRSFHVKSTFFLTTCPWPCIALCSLFKDLKFPRKPVQGVTPPELLWATSCLHALQHFVLICPVFLPHFRSLFLGTRSRAVPLDAASYGGCLFLFWPLVLPLHHLSFFNRSLDLLLVFHVSRPITTTAKPASLATQARGNGQELFLSGECLFPQDTDLGAALIYIEAQARQYLYGRSSSGLIILPPASHEVLSSWNTLLPCPSLLFLIRPIFHPSYLSKFYSSFMFNCNISWRRWTPTEPLLQCWTVLADSLHLRNWEHLEHTDHVVLVCIHQGLGLHGMVVP